MVKRQTKLSLNTFIRTARAHATLFLSRENVKFITLGYKEKGGEITDQLAIKVYVVEKILSSNLEDYNLLPNEIGAISAGNKPLQATIPIDVVPIGKGNFSLLGIKGGDQFYLQSVNINGSCAILNESGSIFTNSHVAANHNYDFGNSPAPVNAVFNHTIYPGIILKISKLRPTGNRMDAAIIDLVGFDPGYSWTILGNLSITGPVAKLNEGGTFEYFSGSDHVVLSLPEPTTHSISFQLDNSGTYYGFDGFYQLQVDESSPSWPRPGHSGSMLLKNINGEWHPAGLVFGRAEFNSRTFVCVYSWDDVITWSNKP